MDDYSIKAKQFQDMCERIFKNRFPEKDRPKDNVVLRSEVKQLNLPIMRYESNKIELYFGEVQ